MLKLSHRLPSGLPPNLTRTEQLCHTNLQNIGVVALVLGLGLARIRKLHSICSPLLSDNRLVLLATTLGERGIKSDTNL